jgi:hypothetical protein
MSIGSHRLMAPRNRPRQSTFVERLQLVSSPQQAPGTGWAHGFGSQVVSRPWNALLQRRRSSNVHEPFGAQQAPTSRAGHGLGSQATSMP